MKETVHIAQADERSLDCRGIRYIAYLGSTNINILEVEHDSGLLGPIGTPVKWRKTVVVCKETSVLLAKGKKCTYVILKYKIYVNVKFPILRWDIVIAICYRDIVNSQLNAYGKRSIRDYTMVSFTSFITYKYMDKTRENNERKPI